MDGRILAVSDGERIQMGKEQQPPNVNASTECRDEALASTMDERGAGIESNSVPAGEATTLTLAVITGRGEVKRRETNMGMEGAWKDLRWELLQWRSHVATQNED